MQNDEWHNGYLVRKCQVEDCPQPALKTPRRFRFGDENHNFVEVFLCPYHNINATMVGHSAGWQA